MLGCFQRRLFICLFVCQHDNFRMSKHGMMKLGGRCIVQKSRPSLNLGVIAPRECTPPKMWHFAELRCMTQNVNKAMQRVHNIGCNNSVTCSSLSCVYSFGSYRVDKQTHPQTNRRRQNIQRSLLCFLV